MSFSRISEIFSSLMPASYYIALSQLSVKDRRKFYFIALINLSLGVLDFFALAIISILGAIAVRGLNKPPNAELDLGFLDFNFIAKYSFQYKVAILASIACLILITRTLLSIYLNRRILFFLSAKGATLSSNLIARLLSSSIEVLKERSIQENLYAITSGSQRLMVGVLGILAQILADLFLLLYLVIGIWLLDPTLAASTTIIFMFLAWILYQVHSKRAGIIGKAMAETTIKSNSLIIEVLSTFREAFVKRRQGFYAQKIARSRYQLANLEAELAFMPLFNKYILEIAVVVSAICVAAIQFLINDSVQAITALLVFIVAGSRIAPAILRIQQGLIAVRSSSSSAEITIELIQKLPIANFPYETVGNSQESKDLRVFNPTIQVKDLSFAFQNSESEAINNVSFEIDPGTVVAFVGPSGGGKTTLVDLMLGLMKPTSGEVTISGERPNIALDYWKGAIAYVPQDVLLVDGSIKDNIILGYKDSEISETDLQNAINLAALDDFISELPQGVNTQVGDFGSRLSGGQRQRIGIARAFVSQPKLIFLDEVTSALDADSEKIFVSALDNMKGHATVVLIAHRLSSIKHINRILYFDKGKVLAEGSFNELRDLLPDFDRQAKFMGL